jgi:hypothetical protein
MKAFFKGWFGEVGPADGCSEQAIRDVEVGLELKLPAALREWYALASMRADVWSRQDWFLTPEKLRIMDEELVIYIENQAVVRWGVRLDDLTHDDPPVYVTDRHDTETVEECPAISIFALAQMLLISKFSGSRFSANGQATKSSLTAIARKYERLEIPDLNWPKRPTRFYGGRDLVIETNGEDWIWVSGRQSATFREALDLIASTGVTWNHIAEE